MTSALVCFDAGNLNIRTISNAHSIHGLSTCDCDDKNLEFSLKPQSVEIVDHPFGGHSEEATTSSYINPSAGGSTDHNLKQVEDA